MIPLTDRAQALRKPVKRATLKARQRKVKAANISDVRALVFERDRQLCRIPHCLTHKAPSPDAGEYRELELAHIHGRGMGGNPTLSRDTTANTFCCCAGHHGGQVNGAARMGSVARVVN